MFEILRIVVAVLIADLLLERWHAFRRRARMRELNRLSQAAKSRKRDKLEEAQRRAESASPSGGAIGS